MSQDIALLQRIRIARPCPAEWKDMVGDDRVRFCGQCRLNVYNIAAMTAADAVRLIRENEGQACVQLHRRQDGTAITRDCPIGLRAVKRQVGRAVAAAISLIVLLLHALGWNGGGRALRKIEPFATVCSWAAPPPSAVLLGEVAAPAQPIRGRVAIPTWCPPLRRPPGR